MTQNPVSATEPLSLAYSKLIGRAEGAFDIFPVGSLRIMFPSESERGTDEAKMASRELNESIWSVVGASYFQRRYRRKLCSGIFGAFGQARASYIT